MYEIDLHGFTLKDAKEYLLDEIKKAYDKKVLSIRIIHGFNNGDKIKQFIRNTSMFEKYITKIEPDILNSGATIVNIKLKKY